MRYTLKENDSVEVGLSPNELAVYLQQLPNSERKKDSFAILSVTDLSDEGLARPDHEVSEFCFWDSALHVTECHLVEGVKRAFNTGARRPRRLMIRISHGGP